MGFITRVKTWAAEKLYFTDLNAEFDAIINGTKDGTKDVNVSACNVNGTLRAKGDSAIGDATTDTCTILANVSGPLTNVTVNYVVSNVANITTANVNSVDIYWAMPPVGSIIPWYPFSTNLAAFLNTTHWAYCNGQSKTINGVSETLPDLSGRYLVGFGGATDGDGALASATWATAAVGSALHEVNISHTHYTDIGSTTSAQPNNANANTVAAHTHTLSSAGWAQLYIDTSPAEWGFCNVVGSVTSWTADTAWAADTRSEGTNSFTTGVALDGATDAGGGHTHSIAHTHTVDPANTQSSAAAWDTLADVVSIQPRSVRVRYIMRIK